MRVDIQKIAFHFVAFHLLPWQFYQNDKLKDTVDKNLKENHPLIIRKILFFRKEMYYIHIIFKDNNQFRGFIFYFYLSLTCHTHFLCCYNNNKKQYTVIKKIRNSASLKKWSHVAFINTKIN